jgi:altronate hydrolase
VANNAEQYKRMPEDMDINAGRIITERVTMEAVGREIYDMLLRGASGEVTKSEAQGSGGYEFTP